MGVFDSHEIDVECPNKDCKGKFKAKIGKLRTSRTIQCPKCKGSIDLKDVNFKSALHSAEKGLSDLQKKLNKTLTIKL